MTEQPTQFVRKNAPRVVLACCIGALATWLWRPSSTSNDDSVAARPVLATPATTAPVLASAPITSISGALNKITSAKILQDSAPPEREFLEQLSALNQTDKQAALTLAEKGEQWYSDAGSFAEARRAMRVTLLVDLQRMDEARVFTREFIAKYPDSPYRRLVQGATGIHPRPSGPRVVPSE